MNKHNKGFSHSYLEQAVAEFGEEKMRYKWRRKLREYRKNQERAIKRALEEAGKR